MTAKYTKGTENDTPVAKNAAPQSHNDITFQLNRGKLVTVGNGIYGRCPDCGSIVKINKMFFGSIHICI